MERGWEFVLEAVGGDEVGEGRETSVVMMIVSMKVICQ